MKFSRSCYGDVGLLQNVCGIAPFLATGSPHTPFHHNLIALTILILHHLSLPTSIVL